MQASVHVGRMNEAEDLKHEGTEDLGRRDVGMITCPGWKEKYEIK